MLSEFQQQKLAARFGQLDADGSGVLEQSDLESLADSLCQRLVPADRAAERSDVMAGYRELWRLLSTQADADGDGQVSRDEYMAAMENGVLADAGNYDRSVGRIVDALFRALDADGSGHLDLAELTMMGNAYGMGRSDMEAMFTEIDRDGDGAISRDEFLGAVHDFYFSDDPSSAGRFIFAGVS